LDVPARFDNSQYKGAQGILSGSRFYPEKVCHFEIIRNKPFPGPPALCKYPCFSR